MANDTKFKKIQKIVLLNVTYQSITIPVQCIIIPNLISLMVQASLFVISVSRHIYRYIRIDYFALGNISSYLHSNNIFKFMFFWFKAN